MIRRQITWAIAGLTAAAACKKQPSEPVAPVGPAGSAQQAGSGSAQSAPSDPWASQEPKAARLQHALFWSIEKDGKTTYALGTMHIGVDAESQLPDIVWQKFDAAPAFAMETDLSDASVDDMERKDGKTLHAELGDAEWHKLETAIGSGAARRLDDKKPMVAAMMLELHALPITAPMDGVLLGRAQNQHKRLVFLEPASLQEALLEKWMDARALKDMLDDLPAGEQREKDMLAAYVAGDADKLRAVNDSERDDWKKLGHDVAEYDRMMEEMLYARNASWIAGIEKLHAAGGGFIATGALHMIGTRSVLDLLAQRGYKVTRLTP